MDFFVAKPVIATVRKEMRDFTAVEAVIKCMNEQHELNDDMIVRFAKARQFDEVAASLGVRGNAPTEMMARLLEGVRSDLILIPCRYVRRHCEEQSDEAIHASVMPRYGLLRFARNDGEGTVPLESVARMSKAISGATLTPPRISFALHPGYVAPDVVG